MLGFSQFDFNRKEIKLKLKRVGDGGRGGSRRESWKDMPGDEQD
jgi:hypothetical protein